MRIHPTSSVWSGKPILEAVRQLKEVGVSDQLLGPLDAGLIQLCPQHPTVYNEELVEMLLDAFPSVRFMLHADVKTKNKPVGTIELSQVGEAASFEAYFKEVARLSSLLGASHYSLHAGKRTCSLSELKNKHLVLQEIFGDTPVVVEGLYPFRDSMYLMDSWSEYEWAMGCNIPYVIDLSHTNIVERKFGRNDSLLKELMASPLCREIHVSFNEGRVDNHEVGSEKYEDLWKRYMELMVGRNKSALLFSEGNQTLHQRKMNHVVLSTLQ